MATSPKSKHAKRVHPPARLDMLLDVALKVEVVLGRARMPIHDILSLGQGSVVELDRLVGEPLEVTANGKLIARGEAVVVNDRLGVRIIEVVTDVLSNPQDPFEESA